MQKIFENSDKAMENFNVQSFLADSTSNFTNLLKFRDASGLREFLAWVHLQRLQP